MTEEVFYLLYSTEFDWMETRACSISMLRRIVQRASYECHNNFRGAFNQYGNYSSCWEREHENEKIMRKIFSLFYRSNLTNWKKKDLRWQQQQHRRRSTWNKKKSITFTVNMWMDSLRTSAKYTRTMRIEIFKWLEVVGISIARHSSCVVLWTRRYEWNILWFIIFSFWITVIRNWTATTNIKIAIEWMTVWNVRQ